MLEMTCDVVCCKFVEHYFIILCKEYYVVLWPTHKVELVRFQFIQYSTVQYGTVREEEPSTSPPPSLAPLNLQLKDKTNLGFINIGCKILKSKIFLCWAQSLLHPERQTDLRFSLVIFLGFEFLLPNFWHVNPDNKKLGSLWKCSSLPASNLWSPLLSIMAVEKAIFTKILNKVVKFLYSKYWTSPTF